MASVTFPYVNPVEFVRNTSELAENIIPTHEDKKRYVQIFEQGDMIKFQLKSTSLLTVNYACLVNCETKESEKDFLHRKVTIGTNNYYIFSVVPLMQDGFYQIFLDYNIGAANYKYNSEQIEIRSSHEGSIKIAYTNDNNLQGAFFTDGTNNDYMYIRVKGGFKSDGFSVLSDTETYIDQTHNAVQLSSIPYETEILTIGDNKGVAKWIIKKINRILSLNSLYLSSSINSGRYTKNDGAELEGVFTELYPFGIWSVELIREENEIETEIKTRSYSDSYSQSYS